MQYKIDDNTIWEDTGRVVIHNYPPEGNGTFSYATRIYREYKKDRLGWKDIEGEPVYFHDMKTELVTFAKIMAESEAALDALLRREKFHIPIEHYPF
jgi:hypothetical protein